MSQSLNHKIKSSALGYAISFLLLIGLMTSGIVFISSVNKRVELNYELEEHLLFNNYFSLKYGAKLLETGETEIIHPSGDTSKLSIKEWGAYRAIVSKTHHGKKKVEKSALFGFRSLSRYPALYLPDNRQVVKLCGKTLIEGDVYTSDRGFERGYIAGKNFEGSKLFDGVKKPSEKTLPKLKNYLSSIGIDMFRKDVLKIEGIEKDTIFNFSEQTSLWSTTSPIQLKNKITGNVVIHSFDSIFVTSNSILKNVILIAPIIHFEKGFKGSVQAIASQHIFCDEDVVLNYPSSLILNVEDETGSKIEHKIYIGNNSKVIGGVLLISKKRDFRNPVYLEIDQAIVGGLIYNEGTTEIKGKVIGSVYTADFGLRTGGGEYTNYLLDATLSMQQLPKNFIMPNWLEEETGEPILLTCF